MAEEKVPPPPEPGLHLPTKVVHRISGPVSMYYLRPRSNVYFTEDRPSAILPLVLLWGDRHRDNTGQCEDCSCDKGQKEQKEQKEQKNNTTPPCCHAIYDKAFLQEVDKLAEKNPVDFYTEYAQNFPEAENPSNVLFHHFLHKTTRFCHLRRLRSTTAYETLCPTKHIRWHYADPRFMRHTVEYHLFRVPYQEIHRTTTLPLAHKLGAAFQADPDITSQQKSQFLLLLRTVHARTHMNPFSHETDPVAHQLRQNAITLFQEMMDALLSSESPVPPLLTLVTNIFRAYVRHIQKYKNSVIAKQIQSVKSIVRTDPEELTDFLTSLFLRTQPDISKHQEEYATFSPNTIRILRDTMTRPTFVRPDMDELSSYDIIQFLLAIKWMLFYIRAMEGMFVELYTLFRMLKPPKGSSPPYLTMGYFGAAHTKRLASILQMRPYFDYEVVYEVDHTLYQEPSTTLRCLSIHKPLLLAQDLEAHAQRILSGPTASPRSMYKGYRNVLYEEEAGREAERFLAMGNPFEGGRRRGRLSRKSKGRKTQRKRKTRR